jgi:hypothetical protein
MLNILHTQQTARLEILAISPHISLMYFTSCHECGSSNIFLLIPWICHKMYYRKTPITRFCARALHNRVTSLFKHQHLLFWLFLSLLDGNHASPTKNTCFCILFLSSSEPAIQHFSTILSAVCLQNFQTHICYGTYILCKSIDNEHLCWTENILLTQWPPLHEVNQTTVQLSCCSVYTTLRKNNAVLHWLILHYSACSSICSNQRLKTCRADGGQWSHKLCPLIPGTGIYDTNWIRDWVGPEPVWMQSWRQKSLPQQVIHPSYP